MWNETRADQSALFYLNKCLIAFLTSRTVADQLKLGMPVTPELFDDVTIYFNDVVAFMDLASESTPMEVG